MPTLVVMILLSTLNLVDAHITTKNVANITNNVTISGSTTNITKTNITKTNITKTNITKNVHIITSADYSDYDKYNEHTELFAPKGALIGLSLDGNNCEQAAKAFQKVYGGKLVFIAPYKLSNGAWIIGDYTGHWMNQIYYDHQIIYVDYLNKDVYYDKTSVHSDLNIAFNHKYNDVDVKIFIYGIDPMPYPINWHY
jgi:hypothetical protein